jgi:hypothetical protein
LTSIRGKEYLLYTRGGVDAELVRKERRGERKSKFLSPSLLPKESCGTQLNNGDTNLFSLSLAGRGWERVQGEGGVSTHLIRKPKLGGLTFASSIALVSRAIGKAGTGSLRRPN